MSALSNLVSLSVSHVALNPLVTAPLLWILTKGPPNARDRLLETVSALRDPKTLAAVVKALKCLLALGVAGTVNTQLNKWALNAWRLKSEKKRWDWGKEVAVVTGGCSGIGELVVKRLINKGVRVAVLDIQQLPVSLQGHAHIKLFACDVTNAAAVQAAAKEIKDTLGSPSILWLRKIFDVNVLSNWYTVQAFLPNMVAQNKGHIVTVASTASYGSFAGMVDYSATKAGALAFHEGLNVELKLNHNAPNVLTTSVHPVWVRTPLIAPFEQAIRASGSPVVDPPVVANAVADQIFQCAGAQLFVPGRVARISAVRAWPNWMQEPFRMMISRGLLSATSQKK